jgi:hypothetical protein
LTQNVKKTGFVNTVKGHETDQRNMNSTIKTAAKITEELSKSTKNSDIKQDGIQHKGKIGRVLKEKMGKQSNVWPVY